jgi:hypothetical protein
VVAIRKKLLPDSTDEGDIVKVNTHIGPSGIWLSKHIARPKRVAARHYCKWTYKEKQTVLFLRYGTFELSEVTKDTPPRRRFADIGRMYGMSRCCVRQILKGLLNPKAKRPSLGRIPVEVIDNILNPLHM